MRLHHDGSLTAWHACSQMILAELHSRRTHCQRRGGHRGHRGLPWL